MMEGRARNALNVIEEVEEKLERLDLPFNELGLDPYGISRSHVKFFISALGALYREYFRVEVYGMEHVPKTGRTMIIGNHSGGFPWMGAWFFPRFFFEMNPPRWGHGMVEKFANNWPIVSQLFSRAGQFTGLPENAVRLLEDDRVLMVFPEEREGLGNCTGIDTSWCDSGRGLCDSLCKRARRSSRWPLSR